MRFIEHDQIKNSVISAIFEACHNLNDYTLSCLKHGYSNESNDRKKNILNQIIQNADLAKKEKIPMCQDTGIVTCFVEVGYNVKLNCNLYDAINEGVKEAYDKFYLRKSVADSITRKNTGDNTPAIIHTSLVDGDKIKIKIAPKGAGSENMSQMAMLNPTVGIEGIKKFILDVVKSADGKPCPPIFLGVGIGGNFEKSCLIAKEALLRETRSDDPLIKQLELELIEEINKLNIGPMGLGGKTTCLDVFINTHPCHIASLPIAVNIQCHANRHVEVII